MNEIAQARRINSYAKIKLEHKPHRVVRVGWEVTGLRTVKQCEGDKMTARCPCLAVCRLRASASLMSFSTRPFLRPRNHRSWQTGSTTFCDPPPLERERESSLHDTAPTLARHQLPLLAVKPDVNSPARTGLHGHPLSRYRPAGSLSRTGLHGHPRSRDRCPETTPVAPLRTSGATATARRADVAMT